MIQNNPIFKYLAEGFVLHVDLHNLIPRCPALREVQLDIRIPGRPVIPCSVVSMFVPVNIVSVFK